MVVEVVVAIMEEGVAGGIVVEVVIMEVVTMEEAAGNGRNSHER